METVRQVAAARGLFTLEGWKNLSRIPSTRIFERPRRIVGKRAAIRWKRVELLSPRDAPRVNRTNPSLKLKSLNRRIKRIERRLVLFESQGRGNNAYPRRLRGNRKADDRSPRGNIGKHRSSAERSNKKMEEAFSGTSFSVWPRRTRRREIDRPRVERCEEREEICQRWRGEKDNGFIYCRGLVTRIFTISSGGTARFLLEETRDA